jgi:ABC-2 type transport system permease protein
MPLTLELKHVLRERAVPVALVVLVCAGIAGVVHGRRLIERQRMAIDASAALQREQHHAILGPLPASANAGDQLFSLFYHTVHEPSAWAPVSVGQRDVQAFNLKIRMLALHGQLYDSDLVNPLLAAFGNFDLAFVLVYLGPLLVIALAYNVWSAERELGTWDLVRSQPVRPVRVLMLKLVVRAGLVLLALLALVLLAAWMLALPLDARFLIVLSLAAAYTAVWVGLVLVFVALGRGSDFNLAALVGVWILSAVLGPALVNVLGSLRYPLPEALELTVQQRQGYHAAWDRPVRETMLGFYARYPEWAGVAVADDKFSNAWYYAMQQQGDDAAAPAAERYRATLDRRHRWTTRALLMFPPAAFQAALNAVARTDLDSHLAYLDSVAAYHERLKRHFFPMIFANSTVAEVDWSSAPVHRFRDQRPLTALTAPAASLAAGAMLALGVGWISLHRRLR